MGVLLTHVVLMVFALGFTGCGGIKDILGLSDDDSKPMPGEGIPQPYAGSFTGPFTNEETVAGSVIDVIRAKGSIVRNGVTYDAATDTLSFLLSAAGWADAVKLAEGTDLGTGGLVLNTGNSPAGVVIDGGGRVIDLTVPAIGSPLITVGQGVTLTLKHITLKGLNSEDGVNNTAPLVLVNGGNLILETGAVITGNRTAWDGGGVVVAEGGTFTMNDGTISGNTSSLFGGGVWTSGTFIKESGIIYGSDESAPALKNTAPNGAAAATNDSKCRAYTADTDDVLDFGVTIAQAQGGIKR
jgi:hypothetical protein